MTGVAVNDSRLTDELARRVMNWGVHPDRYVKSGRSWLPKWRFSPLSRLDDAFQLLASSNSTYTLECAPGGALSVEVKIGERVGRASGKANARTITLALARAFGLEVER